MQDLIDITVPSDPLADPKLRIVALRNEISRLCLEAETEKYKRLIAIVIGFSVGVITGFLCA